MTQQGDALEQYVIPRYRETTSPAWYHVLHGTVPGHQIDFIYSPEVPQGPLTRTHLAHLGRIIKYIEPRDHTSLAFAIGNLSRDDVQHEAGHGGLALIFGLRVRGVIDHASRDTPPYAHGLLAIDRALDYSILLDAISTFYRRFLQEGPSDATGDFYRSYVQVMREQPHAVEEFLRAYLREFDDLPQPPRSTFGGDFLVTEGAHPQRVTVVHAPNEPFTSIAHLAATLGSVLYRSNIKWTSISNGRDIDIPGGVTVRLVPDGELPRDAKGLVLRLDEVPTDDAEIAQHLFGAHPRETGTVRRVGWREQMAAKKGGSPPMSPAREAPAEGPSARDGDHGAAGTLMAGVLGDPVGRGGISPAATPPRVAPTNPLSASAGAIAASLAQSMPAAQGADETASLPAPDEPSPAPVPEVDDAAKTLAAPLRLDPEPMVDDAAATLAAPLSPSPSPPPSVEATIAEVAPASMNLAAPAKSAAAWREEADLATPAGSAAAAPAVRADSASPPSQRGRPKLTSDATAASVDAVNLARPRSRTGLWIGLLIGVGAIGALLYAFAGGDGGGGSGVPTSGGTPTATPPTTAKSMSTASTQPTTPTTPAPTTEMTPPRPTVAPAPSTSTAPAPSQVASAPVSAVVSAGATVSAAPTPQATPGPSFTKPTGSTTKPGKGGLKGDLRGL